MKTYPAHIWKEDNGSFSVEFPDLPGCFSSGNSLDEAKSNASEALTVYLESLDSRRLSIPAASSITGPDIFQIAPTLNVSFAITLKQERERLGLTQKDVAQKMGVAWSAYQRIENPNKTNPTLTTIGKLEKVFGKQFFAF